MSGENVYHIVLDTDPNHGEVDSVTFDLTNTSTADEDRDDDDEGHGEVPATEAVMGVMGS